MIRIYYRNKDGTLGMFEASDYDNHVDAINAVQSALGRNYRKPMLAVIK